MTILKCKMCGGNLNVTDNDTVCTCEYCGTIQTIPLIDSDKKARLFNRANDYRLSNDFSKAYNAYEAIVSENPSEAEAYWGMILSEYGVEYVDDPKTGKKIPTCHRTSLKSIKTNNNYLKAIEYADIEGKMIYEDEADQLDRLQKDILSVSSREKSYDVFICYKESDDNGERTIDSVIAQELYDELTNRSLNVFFARISLEDKFGQNYEPYIYNALRSAKVMLLVTTSNEHCNATWVKNEWSRYLDFIKNDISRSLIPVIKGMSPYELPDELQKLQVLDLNKIGAKQDLIRGVIKITGKDVLRQTTSNNTSNTNSLLKRGFMSLEDEDWTKADEVFEQALNLDPNNGEAYLGKLLSNLKVKYIDDLKTLDKPFDDDINYNRIIRYGSKELSTELESVNNGIRVKKENDRINSIYEEALRLREKARKEKDFRTIIENLKPIKDYKDSSEIIQFCNKSIKAIRKNSNKNIKIGIILVAAVLLVGAVCLVLLINNAIFKLRTCSVGDIVKIGKYEQDNNVLNGKEDIEWRVLAKKKNMILLVSKYALDAKQYDDSGSATWNGCTLSKWLNSEFYSETFSDSEKKLITTSIVMSDKLFLLSIQEVNKYFSTNADRQCKATKYAYSNGAYKNTSNGNCWWWLRTSGSVTAWAAYVNDLGSANRRGEYVNDSSNAVRPAMWISLD